MQDINFINDKAVFSLKQPEQFKGLYFPIASEKGIKSVVTPLLGGDNKLDQNHFILEPTSIENLHNNRSTRNFWCVLENGYWSAAGNSAQAEMMRFSDDADETEVKGGFLWHTVTRKSKEYGLEAKITSFVPHDENVEIMMVELTNNGETQTVTPVAAVPIYGRSADNLRDHRHVTSLLHRIVTTENGVQVKPTLSFDERGHQRNTFTYFVCGQEDGGKTPVEFYPTVDEFIGERGTYTNPEAIALGLSGVAAGTQRAGSEAIGALKFEKVTLNKGESKTYIVLIGATEDEADIASFVSKYNTVSAVEAARVETENYWNEQVNITFKTGDDKYDQYMRWICFQPFLRRVYGCSFLPHHDYGKGGRGWRDLWQDCLALLIMDPSDVRQMILGNFGGVRVDGTNATIIGDKPGEFKADRNGITRVWMDHGMWPFLTTKLYLEQTGDLELLNTPVSYFKDAQVKRGEAYDDKYEASQGNLQKTEAGDEYKGTVLEHLILQHVCAMCETGEHGIIRLRDADWNDALDMASKRGESVAFTCAYSGNVKSLADYVEKLAAKTGTGKIKLMEELYNLLVGIGRDKEAAFEQFKIATAHNLSGNVKEMEASELAEILNQLANNMISHVRKQEWISDDAGNSWYNSYYDNDGQRVEGQFGDAVRMMLTGQVFSIMSGTASKEQVASICKSADKYLYEKKIGGYRLNNDFNQERYNMGRAFGFAFGEKENGAVFSHMTVMYANALYQRGFVKEGYKALQSLGDTAMDFETSQIYPGVPEYFNNKGRGLYHYLTGAASWYALTMITEVFGAKGAEGNLRLAPKLVKEQLDKDDSASVKFTFADKKFVVNYKFNDVNNMEELLVKYCDLDGSLVAENVEDGVTISKSVIERLGDEEHVINVEFN